MTPPGSLGYAFRDEPHLSNLRGLMARRARIIYILLVAEFGGYKVPLVILTPLALTLDGTVRGHWLFGALFTATS